MLGERAYEMVILAMDIAGDHPADGHDFVPGVTGGNQPRGRKYR